MASIAENLHYEAREPEFLRSWFCSGQGRGEIWFPGFSAVVGEGLFEMVGIRSDVRPDNPNEDGSAVVRLLIVELAAAILEFTDGRCADRAVAAVGKIQAPLMRLRVVQKKSQDLEMAAG